MLQVRLSWGNTSTILRRINKSPQLYGTKLLSRIYLLQVGCKRNSNFLVSTAMSGQCWPNVGPMLDQCWANVGPMLSNTSLTCNFFCRLRDLSFGCTFSFSVLLSFLVKEMPSMIILATDDQPAPPVASQTSNQPQGSHHSSVAVEEPKALSSASSAIQDTKDLQRELNLIRGLLFQMQKDFAAKVKVLSVVWMDFFP